MPERTHKQGDWPKGEPWTLQHAHNVGQVLRAKCTVCHIKPFYKPIEIKEIMGNGTIDDVRRKFRCERCHELILDAEFFFPVGEEAIQMRFRRLVEIKWIRRIVWRDE